MHDISVAVVGPKGVGKTSICSYNYDGDDTYVCHRRRYRMENCNIYFCDDTDSPLKCDVMLAVYDTSNIDTLKQLECTVKSLYRHIPTIVVGNKNDLVSGILGGHTQHLPSEIDVLYTSATTGRNMIDLIHKIIERGWKPDAPARSCNIQ